MQCFVSEELVCPVAGNLLGDHSLLTWSSAVAAPGGLTRSSGQPLLLDTGQAYENTSPPVTARMRGSAAPGGPASSSAALAISSTEAYRLSGIACVVARA
jgi:hypothetical protein